MTPHIFVQRKISRGMSVVVAGGNQGRIRAWHGSGELMDWIGIELDKPFGDNDGSWGGARRFQCRPGHGLFVRPSAVLRVIPEPAQLQLRRRAFITIPIVLALIALLSPLLLSRLSSKSGQDGFATQYAQQTSALSKVLSDSSVIFDFTTTLPHTLDFGDIDLPWYDNNARIPIEMGELSLRVHNLSEAATLYFAQCQSVTSHNLHRNKALQTMLHTIIETRQSLALTLIRAARRFVGFPQSQSEECFESNLREHQTKILEEAHILHELDSSLRVSLDRTSVQLRSVLELIIPAFSIHDSRTEDSWQKQIRWIARFFGVHGGRNIKSTVSQEDMLAQLKRLEKAHGRLVDLKVKINTIDSPTRLLAATSRELVRMLDRSSTTMGLSLWLLEAQLRVVEDGSRRMQLKPSIGQ